MKKAPPDKKNPTITAVAVFLFMMFAASGNIVAVLLLILPIIFFLTIYLSIKKGKQEYDEKVSYEDLRRGVYTAAGDLGQELRRAKEYIEQELLAEEPEQTVRSAPRQRPDTEREQGVDPTLFEGAERRHLQSLSGSHNEIAHYEMELRDLLNAGIIERDEYNDRLRELRKVRG